MILLIFLTLYQNQKIMIKLLLKGLIRVLGVLLLWMVSAYFITLIIHYLQK